MAGKTTKAEPPALTKPSLFGELGTSGLLRFSGYVNEEFLPQLRGDKALKIYREMKDNSPVLGAMLFAVEMLARGVTWGVEVDGESPEELQARDLIETCLTDMSSPWEDCLAEFLTMLPFGWSYHEVVYKMRHGMNGPAGQRSQYTDGLIGWRKLPIRAQESRVRWQFDPEGGIQGMYQRAAPQYREVFLPIEKCLLFRTKPNKNSPEGYSIFRNAYRAWFFAKRIEEIEGIGIERDLNGIPVLEVPAPITSATATSAEQAIYAECKKIVTNIRNDEQAGVVLPQSYDAETKQPLYKLSLLSVAGRKNFDTSSIIDRWDTRMAMTVLADFIMLGHGETGSWALASSKTKLFSHALGAWLKQVASVMNRHAIPRLLAVNGMNPKSLPRIVHGDIESLDLTELGDFISKLSGAGFRLAGDREIENRIRRQVHWPEISEEKWADREVGTARQDQEEARAELDAARGQMGAATERIHVGRNAGTLPKDLVAESQLNGAQVTALLGVLESVAADQLPLKAATAVIQAAFPSIPADLVRRMLAGLEGYAVNPAAAEKAPEPRQ